MAQRKIPPNRRSLTGRLVSRLDSQAKSFESSLERDFYTILDFDSDVASFEEQPVTIEYADLEGKRRTYTPDVLVKFRNHKQAKPLVPTLYEIKRREDLFKHLALFKPRFLAARRYARQRGWRFKIVTEKEIRSPYLANIKFLRQFIGDNEKIWDFAFQLSEELQRRKFSTPKELLDTVAKDSDNRGKAMRSLWRMVAHRMVGIDLAQPLTMESELWDITG